MWWMYNFIKFDTEVQRRHDEKCEQDILVMHVCIQAFLAFENYSVSLIPSYTSFIYSIYQMSPSVNFLFSIWMRHLAGMKFRTDIVC